LFSRPDLLSEFMHLTEPN